MSQEVTTSFGSKSSRYSSRRGDKTKEAVRGRVCSTGGSSEQQEKQRKTHYFYFTMTTNQLFVWNAIAEIPIGLAMMFNPAGMHPDFAGDTAG